MKRGLSGCRFTKRRLSAKAGSWKRRASAWLPVRQNADAFLRYRSRAEGKRVGVIGRFAYLEKRLEPICDLYVIERRPGANDYPDAACEYLLPEMDAVFITGSTAANKTLPRLLELSKHAFTAVCGPSTTMAAELFPFGADALCGFCITDADKALYAAENGTSIFECGEMAVLERKNG